MYCWSPLSGWPWFILPAVVATVLAELLIPPHFVVIEVVHFGLDTFVLISSLRLAMVCFASSCCYCTCFGRVVFSTLLVVVQGSLFWTPRCIAGLLFEVVLALFCQQLLLLLLIPPYLVVI